MAKTDNDNSGEDNRKEVDANLRRSSRRSKQRDTDQPKPVKSLEHRRVEPSDSHKLLALLEQHKMLLRVYTQNIDGLETTAGVSSRKMVYAHGSLKWAKCCKCQRKVDSDDIMPFIEQGRVPRCQASKSTSWSPSHAKAAAINVKKRTRTSILARSPSSISTGSASSSASACVQATHDSTSLYNGPRRKRQRTQSSARDEKEPQQLHRSSSATSTR